MTAPWMAALDAQLNLVRFWQGSEGPGYAAQVLESLRMGQFGAIVGDWTPEDLASTEAERANRAETYFVRRDMAELTVRSCRSRTLIPQPLKDYHLPTPSGFAFFQDEVELPWDRDGQQEMIPIKAVMWRPTVITVGEWPQGERVLGVALSFYGSRETMARRLGTTPTGPTLYLHSTHGWPFDVDWYGGKFDPDSKTFEEELDKDAELRRFMTGFWAHLQTTVYVMTDSNPTDRHTKKRAVRAGFLGDPEKIRVIVLRKKYNRKTENEGDGTKREFSHRFPRVAHWRNQWYPSQQQHHQIWIDETIVGDESLPLLVRDRVYDWKR